MTKDELMKEVDDGLAYVEERKFCHWLKYRFDKGEYTAASYRQSLENLEFPKAGADFLAELNEQEAK